MKKNVILATIYNYTYEDIKPFLLSLKSCNYSDDIVIFYDRLKQEDIKKISEKIPQINLIPYKYTGDGFRNKRHESWIKYKPWVRAWLPEWFKIILVKPMVNIPWLRFYLYKEFLKKHQNDYKQILMCDVRDVWFQGEPFSKESEDGLNVFMEDPRLTIKTCPSNSKWIQELFGRNVLNEIGDCLISCSGTICGDYISVMLYLNIFLETVLKVNSFRPTGGDQGIHNYILQKEIKNYNVYKNGDGGVLTMGYLNKENVHIKNGKVIGSDGNLIALLHQYDRHADLQKMLFRQISILD